MANKQQKKIVKQEEIDVRPLYKTEPAITDAPYDCTQASLVDDLLRQQQAVDTIVAGYGAGNSIPDLLRAILTELVKIRVGGAHV